MYVEQKLIFDARVEAAKMGAADAATLANAGTWAAGAKGIGQVAGVDLLVLFQKVAVVVQMI